MATIVAFHLKIGLNILSCNFSIAIVIPLFNEEENLEFLVTQIEKELDEENFLLILVDDGSDDNTVETFKNLSGPKAGNERKIIKLSRNFGHSSAIMAGLNAIPYQTPIVVVMDGDLQDQPSDIMKLISEVRLGSDCAYAVREPKSGSRYINFLTKIFYRVQNAISNIRIPSYAGNFSAFNSRFLSELLHLQEYELFFPGARAYVGFSQKGVPVSRGKRYSGTTKMGIKKLLSFGITGIMSFSDAPIRIIFYFGFLITFFCGLLSFIVFILRISGVIQVLGFTSLAILILLLSGVQIMLIGIVGEYLRKIFIESKKRPSWIVEEVISG